MGKNKSKSSRKGKKEWRKNISTEDIEDYFEESTKDAVSGGSLTEVPSDSLFFVDKSIDLSAKRKIEKHREKVLRYESVLQRNAFVQPVPSSIKRKSKTKRKEIEIAKGSAQYSQSNEGAPISSMIDIWDDQGEENIKIKKISKPMIIPAVEVEPPGCSYNPTFESHQDSLARAVADEMQKIYRNELGPEPVPLVVPGEVVEEEDMYFLDADNGSDEDDDPNKDLCENGDGDPEKRNPKTKRVTRVVQNRRARHNERLKMEAEAKKFEVLSKELDSLPDIIQEIAKEEEEKNKRHLRRAIVKQEKLRSGPPRLGRHKFEPAPVQVLLSEEITGSLRKLKACCTLAKDRYKSLEKRGLIAPTAKSRRK